MAINTIYTYPLNGTNREFHIPFEYLARKFVVITLIGTNRRELILTTEYRFTTRAHIQTNKVWGPADGYERIEVRRLTSATERLVDFSDGSILRASDLNISQVQTLHVAEEARNMVADTISQNADGNLDARGRRLVNLADATEPDHAVTLRQEQAWAQSTLGNRNAAEAARDQALVSQKANEGTRQEVAASRDRAYLAEQRSEASAVRSEAAAGTIGNNVQLAQAAREGAEAAREGAETAREGARASALTATNEANRAKTEADRSGDKFTAYNGSLGFKNMVCSPLTSAPNDIRYAGALEIREAAFETTTKTGEWREPALSYHYGGAAAVRLSMDTEGRLKWAGKAMRTSWGSGVVLLWEGSIVGASVLINGLDDYSALMFVAQDGAGNLAHDVTTAPIHLWLSGVTIWTYKHYEGAWYGATVRRSAANTMTVTSSHASSNYVIRKVYGVL